MVSKCWTIWKHCGTTSGEPSVPIEITECGIYTPLKTPGAGYWFDKPDEEAYSGISPIFMVTTTSCRCGSNNGRYGTISESVQCSHFALTAICVDEYETQELVTERIYDLIWKILQSMWYSLRLLVVTFAKTIDNATAVME